MSSRRLPLFFSSLLVALVLIGTIATTALAATLTLQEIGASTVGGRRISSWTYMGSNPIISGTTDPSATVTVSIDETPAMVTADSAGAWSYMPTTLTVEGTHPVVITSGDQTISFTLAISPYAGATAYTGTESGTAKGGVTELPLSGGVQDTLQLLSLGGALLAMGGVSWWVIREFARDFSS